MSSRGPITNADTLRARRAAQRNIRRLCSCGRKITGNVAWWSHTHTPDGAERPGHSFNGRTH